MGRTLLTGKACASCRKKKRKCDGLTPCSNCRSRQDICNYSPSRWTSKDGLRSEIQELKKRQESTDTVLDALRSPTHSIAVLEQLQRGESVAEIEEKLRSLLSEEGVDARAGAGLDAISDADAEGDEDEEEEDDEDNGGDDETVRIATASGYRDTASAASTSSSAAYGLPRYGGSSGNFAGGSGGSVNRAGISPITTATGDRIISPGSASSSSVASFSSPITVAVTPPIAQPLHRVPSFDVAGAGQTFSLGVMEYHLNLLFSWECAPLTMLAKEAFIADFVSGRDRYCSLALIYAIVAFTSRLGDGASADSINPNLASHPTTPSPPAAGASSANSPVPGQPGRQLPGQLYFERGLKLLAEKTQCETLPDIQALGLLSLREVCTGNEVTARALAQRCLMDISAMRQRGIVEDAAFNAATMETFAGAYCLASMLDLVTYAHPGASSSLAWHKPTQLEVNRSLPSPITPPQPGEQQYTWQGSSADPTQRGGLASGSGRPRPNMATGKKAETFSDIVVQITSLVCSRLPLLAAKDPVLVLSMYEKCLEWYNSALGMLQVGANWTPSSLFLHMYYHFSLGVLFRPLMDQPTLICQSGTLSPRVICAESAQAVIALAQSFAKLFTLRRTPSFLPYFVYAAGVMQRELKHGSTDQPQQQQQPPDLTSGLLDTVNLGPAVSMNRDIEGTAEAATLRLLSEMAATHLAAAEASADLRGRLVS